MKQLRKDEENGQNYKLTSEYQLYITLGLLALVALLIILLLIALYH